MKIEIPELSFVALVGISGSGKSTFAARHFLPTEVLSSDAFRGWVSDDDNDLSATGDAFDALYYVARKRLARGRLTVVDATNVNREDRRHIVRLAREHHVLPVAIVLDVPEDLAWERTQARDDRQFPRRVLRHQRRQLGRKLAALRREGFRYVHVLRPEEVDDVELVRRKPWTDRRDETGPFDIVGDVHGCLSELRALIDRLGWTLEERDGRWTAARLDHRKLLFVGDLVDRGPDSPGVLRLAMDLVEQGVAICIPGNHEAKLLKKLNGKNVRLTHGLAETVEQLERETPEFIERVRVFIDGLVSHFVLDEGRLVVAHAGMREELQGRASGKVRAFALYGETTGETDEFGLPVRYDWASDYRGEAAVVYGHTPVPRAEWLNNTICVDTGCVFGGQLTALRWPERELVQVPAERVWFEPVRPLEPEADRLSAQQQADSALDLSEVTGKRIIHSRLRRTVTIREDQSAAALEVMSRFAVDPRWLVYLPPTMSPSETSAREGLLEHPNEALGYYASAGVEAVCQAKHMGSRTVVVVCRDEGAARGRFGVEDQGIGACYTRTGRPMFTDAVLQAAFLARVRDALDQSGIFAALQSDWAVLDCELMPWSAKAQSLLERQYAPVGAAATAALSDAVAALDQTRFEALAGEFRERLARVERYVASYRPYCWPVEGLGDLKLAPFHLLASEGAVHIGEGRDHTWHMETLAKLAAVDPELFVATPWRRLDPSDEGAVADAVAWWTEYTDSGGEGMVVKPLDFVAYGKKGLLQPAVKCRGPEYLRIIYGPEYDLPRHLERLRKRSLRRKRSLALREFALGIEALERFVRREPLRRVHECVFGVLAMESEPVDPRL